MERKAAEKNNYTKLNSSFNSETLNIQGEDSGQRSSRIVTSSRHSKRSKREEEDYDSSTSSDDYFVTLNGKRPTGVE